MVKNISRILCSFIASSLSVFIMIMFPFYSGFFTVFIRGAAVLNLRSLKNTLFRQIAASDSNFNPRNTQQLLFPGLFGYIREKFGLLQVLSSFFLPLYPELPYFWSFNNICEFLDPRIKIGQVKGFQTFFNNTTCICHIFIAVGDNLMQN